MDDPPRDEAAAERGDQPTAPNRWSALALRFGVPLVVTLVLDLATKAWIFRDGSLTAAQQRYLGHPWIQPHVNRGVAWSMLDDHPGVVAVLTAVLIPVLAWAWWRWFRGQRLLEDLAFGCILGGALGNAWDRLLAWLPEPAFGGVRDFIHCDLNHIGIDYVWPTFNVADMGISVGFLALVLASFRGKRKEPSENAGS